MNPIYTDKSAVYNATYKCRLCGKKFTHSSTSDYEAIKIAYALAAETPSISAQAPTMHFVHGCLNGNIGIADFQGWEMERNPSESPDDTEELKPCPFCGKPAGIVLSQVNGKKLYHVQCMNDVCFVHPSTDEYSALDIAIKLWNGRSDG